MKLAIMIPMDDKAARDAWAKPNDWEVQPPAIRWPEVGKGGRPLLPADVATLTQAQIEEDLAKGHTHLAIITRSEVAVLRVRRMVAEGAALDVTIHFPGSDHEPVTVGRDGAVPGWPEGLFLEGYREVLAIQHARQAQDAKP